MVTIHQWKNEEGVVEQSVSLPFDITDDMYFDAVVEVLGEVEQLLHSKIDQSEQDLLDALEYKCDLLEEMLLNMYFFGPNYNK